MEHCPKCDASGYYRSGKFYHDGTASTACYFRQKVAPSSWPTRSTMTGSTQWSDASYTAEQKAYADGEYDGYWGDPHREGTWSNTEWAAYLRGWLAGLEERLEEPTDKELNVWLHKISADIAEGER